MKRPAISAALALISISLLFFLSFRRPDTLQLLSSSTASLEQQQEQQQKQQQQQQQKKCPSYFAWIHEDLAPWQDKGISQENMEDAKKKGHFHLAIIDGKIYYQRYQECIQTRDEFTIKGLIELIQRFPSMVPDMELVFVCNDFPEVFKAEIQGASAPPPVFSYCTTRRGEHYDILFPDWSFWGWPDVRIRPWEEEKQEILLGSSSKDWNEREPFAYWKGNIWVSTKVREDLLQCNNTQYNIVVYYLDWGKEAAEGYHTSALSQQCHVRYKVYVEGRGWSASLKYIMSCGSTVLHVEPDYWEFFARSLLPYVHYWPINRNDLCPSIKRAVEWGNANPYKAAAIGKRGQIFVEKDLTMDYVYSYMLHLLQAYAKLQKFKPVIPEGVQPWSNYVANDTKSETKLCSMLPRDQHFIAQTAAKQEAGYSAAGAAHVAFPKAKRGHRISK